MKNIRLLVGGLALFLSCSTVVIPYQREPDADIVGFLNAKGKVDSVHIAYKASQKFCLMGIGKDEILYATQIYERPLNKETIEEIYHDFKGLRVKFIPAPKSSKPKK